MNEPDTKPTRTTQGQMIGGWLQLGLIVGLVLVAIGANRALSSVSNAPEPSKTPIQLPTVEVVVPEVVPSEFVLPETGVVRARNLIGVMPQVGGRIVSVSAGFVSGGSFSAGETLFQIDQTDYVLALNRAAADLETARSTLLLELAEAETARREWRLVNGEAAVPPLVAREPQITQARSGVAAAEARVADAETALSRTRFSFPFDGRVLTSDVEIGQTVSLNQSYGQVYATGSLEVSVSVTIDELDRLQPAIGRRAVVTGKAAGRQPRVQGKVLRVDAALDERTRQANLILGFSDQADFMPGRFVNVEVTGDRYPATLRIDAAAISPSGIAWVVSEGRLFARRPEILMRSDTLVTTLPFDVAEGVVTTRVADAREGAPVEVILAAGTPPRERGYAGR